MNDALIFEAIRTPRGKGKADGALHEVKAIDLVAGLMRAMRDRLALDTERVDDVILGCVSPVGEQGANLARLAALYSGWSESVPGVTLNRYCASGLEAVNLAAAKVQAGHDDLIVAGGFESMSRVPMGSDGGPLLSDPEVAAATHFVPQGVSADLIASLEGFSREQLDVYAARSHQRAAQARTEGRFDRSLVPVRDLAGRVLLDRDETIREATSAEILGRLNPSFEKVGAMGFDSVALGRYPQLTRIAHLHHAGNSSGIVDGAALVLIGTEAVGRKLGLKARARICATAVIGSEPTIMLTGPAPASRKALARAGLRIEDIDLFEINEAFAAVVLKAVKDLGLDEARVNVNGGAIAMGHPLGATGAMLLGTALDELERRAGRYALVTLCVGAGMGVATIIERL